MIAVTRKIQALENFDTLLCTIMVLTLNAILKQVIPSKFYVMLMYTAYPCQKANTTRYKQEVLFN